MIIRKLGLADADLLYELGAQQFKGEFWYNKRFLKETLKTFGRHYGAFEGKNLIGSILTRMYDKPKSWIYFFVVDKQFRRAGIGSRLLSAVEKSLPKGYFMIYVDFEDSDIEAKKFYNKRGFKKQAKINHWFGRDMPGLLYSKKL